MEVTALSAADGELLEAVKRTADTLHRDDIHEVASALRTGSGEVFAGINIKARMRFADVCGEVAALSAMVSAGHRDPACIVAMWADGRGTYKLMPPCGRCRELISDFDPQTWVIVGTMQQPFKVRIAELLPLKTW